MNLQNGDDDKMTKFKKHLGEGKEIEIGEEKFIIKPLTTDEAPLFFKFMKLFDGKNMDLSKMDGDVSAAFTKILNSTLQKSFPEEWKENVEEVKQFGLRYMMELFEAILDINIPKSEENKGNIEEMKQRLAPKQ